MIQTTIQDSNNDPNNKAQEADNSNPLLLGSPGLLSRRVTASEL
jgi:hypothetical protein